MSVNEFGGGGRPLVTMVVFAYNQEQYIEEAVKSALDQDYSPLEIILSDDGSTDRTYELMKSCVKTYSGGHVVTVNQMSCNVGLANHMNHVLRSAKGDLIVVAAGDDISVHSRVSETVAAWIESGMKAGLVYSDFHLVDERSVVVKRGPLHRDFSNVSIGQFVTRPFAVMCTYSISRSLVDMFPDLNPDLRNEDIVFPFRALLLGKEIVYLPRQLVYYRVASDVGHNSGIDVYSRMYINLRIARTESLLGQLSSDAIHARVFRSDVDDGLSKLAELVHWQRFLASEGWFVEKLCRVLLRIGKNPRSTVEYLSEYLEFAHPKFKGFLKGIYLKWCSLLSSCFSRE